MTEQLTPEPAAPQEQAPSGFVVPEAYATKGWAKDIKTPDDLWKLTDNAQSLIGKRAAPSPEAPAEEWNNYMRQLGMPEQPDGYQLSDIEGMENLPLSESKPVAQKMMHEAGLTQRQADALWKAFVKTEAESQQQMQAAHDAKFEELASKYFGEKSNEAQSIAQEAIKSFVPEELRGSIATAQPEQLAAMIALASNAKAEIDRVKKEYGAEGKLASGESATNVSIEDTRRELAALRSSRDAADPTSPKFKETRAKIDEMSKMVSSFYNKA